jgi:hypothetical protein
MRMHREEICAENDASPSGHLAVEPTGSESRNGQ